MDCPESAEMYIHRVGRTARFNASGKSLLILTPQEEPGMLKQLAQYSINLERLKVNPRHEVSVEASLSSALSRDPEFKQTAMKAFVNYYKWVFHQPNKEIFNIANVPAAELARSMGLAGTPIVKIVQCPQNNVKDYLKVLERGVKEEWAKMAEQAKDDKDIGVPEETEVDPSSQKKKKPTRIDKMMQQKNTTVFSDSYVKMLDTEDADDLFISKKQGTQAHEAIDEHEDRSNKPLSKTQRAKAKKNAWYSLQQVHTISLMTMGMP